MKYTENLNLKMPEDGDRFDVADMNDNMEKLDNTVGGLTFIKCTQSEYDALETHDENTVYYAVDESGKVKQYLGGAELSGGNSAPTAAISAKGLIGKMGLAEAYTEE